MNNVFVVCDECEGFGFDVVLENPWEEAFNSPAECRTCVGMGLIPIDLEEDNSVVLDGCYTRSNDAGFHRGKSSELYNDWDNGDC